MRLYFPPPCQLQNDIFQHCKYLGRSFEWMKSGVSKNFLWFFTAFKRTINSTLSDSVLFTSSAFSFSKNFFYCMKKHGFLRGKKFMWHVIPTAVKMRRRSPESRFIVFLLFIETVSGSQCKQFHAFWFQWIQNRDQGRHDSPAWNKMLYSFFTFRIDNFSYPSFSEWLNKIHIEII